MLYIRQIFNEYNKETIKRTKRDMMNPYNSGKKALTALEAISKKVDGSTQIRITIMPEIKIPRPNAGP
jgi:hypothetical protein